MEQQVQTTFDPLHSVELGLVSKALCEAQKEIKSLSKDATGYGYKYLSLSVLMDYSLPIITKHGLSLSQFEDGLGNLVTMLIHSESGQYIKGKSTLIDPDKIEMKGVNIEQKRGSILSYEKRYALQAILCVTTNEDDNDCSPKGYTKPASKTSYAKKAPAKKLEAASTEEKPRTKFKRTQKGAENGSDGLDL